MQATAVKDLTGNGTCQRLFKLSPPMRNDEKEVEHVIASRCNAMCAAIQWFYEVYLFESDSEGEIQDWCELPGSQKHCEDLDKPLRDLGYEIN